MPFRSIIIALSALLMSSCASMDKPLQARVQGSSNVIDIAAIEYGDNIQIRRFNPVLGLMGSSGAVLDNVFMVTQRDKYEERAGETGKACGELFRKTLLTQLRASGYLVRMSDIPYWDYYRKPQQELRRTSGGILRIQIKQLGFWSSGMKSPYISSVFAIAEMIDPRTRKTLYRNRFAIGFSEDEQKLFSAYFGQINLVDASEKRPGYKNFWDLLEHARESRRHLLKTVKTAAIIIADGLGRPAPRYLAVDKPDAGFKESLQ